MKTIETTVKEDWSRRYWHTNEFKADLVDACSRTGMSIASVALTNGINANLLSRWTEQSGQRLPGTHPVDTTVYTLRIKQGSVRARATRRHALADNMGTPAEAPRPRDSPAARSAAHATIESRPARKPAKPALHSMVMHRKKINVLFVSRRNTLRSVMAQACLTHIAENRFHARSCGQPLRVGAAVDPAAVSALRTAGIPLPDIKPRGWNEFVPARGFEAEFVIALDADIDRLQPAWPGQPHTALWAYPDTAAIADPEEAAHKALQTLYSMRRRLELLASLPLYGSDRESVRADIRDLGYMA